MKLKATGNSSSGHRVGYYFDKLVIEDIKKLSSKIECRHFLSTDESEVEIKWDYVVLLNGDDFFPFDASKHFYILEKETPPIESELKQTVLYTFNYLKDSFREVVKNSRFLEVSDIHPDAIDKIVRELLQLLSPLTKDD